MVLLFWPICIVAETWHATVLAAIPGNGTRSEGRQDDPWPATLIETATKPALVRPALGSIAALVAKFCPTSVGHLVGGCVGVGVGIGAGLGVGVCDVIACCDESVHGVGSR